jgi:MoxR-like ATPase
VWFPPEFLPGPEQPAGILFLDELTAADQRLQISAYSLILDRRVGHYALPDGWQVIAAGNASFHGAVSHDMGTALADRMFHFNVQTTIDAFLAHAIASDFAPEVMAYLKVRPDKLDDTQAQLAADHLVGASPRGWEDISNVLKSGLSESAQRVFVQGRIGAANAAEFFGVLRELQAAVDVMRLLAAQPCDETAALLPRTLDGLYGMVYGLLAASSDSAALARALEIVEQLPDTRAETALPLREAQTLAMELLMQRALESGLEATVIDSASYRRYSERRRKEGA